MLPLRPALHLSLLATALVAANLAHAEVPASAPFTQEQQHVIQQLSASEVRAATPKIASEAASSVAKTIEGEKQAIEVAKDALELGRKSVDWWLSNISVWLGGLGLLIAVAGIGIPLWMGRKQKVEWQEKLNLLTQKLKEAETAQQHAEAAQQKAEQHAQEIETLLSSARDKASLIPKADEITEQLSGEVLDKLRKEKPPQVVRLIEQAWDAHRRKDWEAAKPLWELLSLIESHDANVWFNLGVAVQRTNHDLIHVAEYFRRSHLLLPEAVAPLNNWGSALFALAMTGDSEASQQHLIDAGGKYAEVTRLQPDSALAFLNWGKALFALAKTEIGTTQHLIDACRKFSEAARLQPDSADVYRFWATTLFDLAMRETGTEKQRYFVETCKQLAEAVRLQPSDADAYQHWGNTILYWVHSLSASEREIKLQEAERVLLQAKALGNLHCLYDLACLRAIQNDPSDARELLQQTREADLLPDYAHLSSDKDLDNLRGLGWFKQLLDEVRQQEYAQII